MKVTADTITDEQIKQLRNEAERLIADAGFALLRIDSPHGSGRPSPATATALDRLAAAWNARRGATP